MALKGEQNISFVSYLRRKKRREEEDKREEKEEEEKKKRGRAKRYGFYYGFLWFLVWLTWISCIDTCLWVVGCKKPNPRMNFVWKVRISMIFDFEYGIMCNLDFGRDFYGFQT